MKNFSPRSFLAGVVLAGALTVGGLAIASGNHNGKDGGMMGGEGMMSQMQEMMSRCNAMMDSMGEADHGGRMMSPERQGGDAS